MLAVTNGCSYDTVYSAPITIYPSTTPNFSFNNNICSGDTMFFFNNTLGINSYSWNFGDGTLLNSNISPYHIYNIPGTFNVTLTVFNQHCTSDIIIPVQIKFTPHPSFYINPDSGCTPLSVHFINVTDSLNYNTYIWNFNNGVTSVLVNPVNQTFVNSSYCHDTIINISLIANNNSCVDTFLSNVRVHPKPVSNFITSDSLFCGFGPPKNVQFYEEAACAQGFQWFIGNSPYSNSLNPIISFPNTGDYNINLVVTNQFMCSDTTKSQYILYPEWEKQVDITLLQVVAYL